MNKRFSRILSVILAVVMMASLFTVGAFAAEKKYTVDLNKVSDTDWNAAKVKLQLKMGWTDTGRYHHTTIYLGDDNLGNPVLLDIGNQWGSGGFTVTYVPIRLICDAVDEFYDIYGLDPQINIDWVPGTATEAGYATLNAPGKGQVKLYVGATSVTAEDGTVYEETTYRFPDGSPLPLCLMRNNRIYVPVRFLSSFLMSDTEFTWKNNASELLVSGFVSRDIAEELLPWDNGVNPNVGLEDQWLELKNMPNARAWIEQDGNDGAECFGGELAFYCRDCYRGMEGTQYQRDVDYYLNHKDDDTLTCTLKVSTIGAVEYAARVKHSDPELCFYNLSPYDTGKQLECLTALLKDLVKSEKDQASILKIVDAALKKINEGTYENNGETTAAGIAYQSSLVGIQYELDEVMFMWSQGNVSGDYSLGFIIWNK